MHQCPGAFSFIGSTLQWRHNERDGVSNHQPHDCLLNRFWAADQRKHQSSASLADVWGIHRRQMNSPHKGPVTLKMFPFDDVIMNTFMICCCLHFLNVVNTPVHIHMRRVNEFIILMDILNLMFQTIYTFTKFTDIELKLHFIHNNCYWRIIRCCLQNNSTEEELKSLRILKSGRFGYRELGSNATMAMCILKRQ